MLNIFIFLCFFGGAFVQSSDDGSCVKIPPEEFENDKLMGRWRDVLRSKTVSDKEIECLEVNFLLTGPDEFKIIYSAKSTRQKSVEIDILIQHLLGLSGLITTLL
ncbi:uncharacterized protein LOC141529409 [Cotesia typhae]|uniref:uncharacterized protein LOC141529409 n=1 Tax=Cotesia typhae TaxID=2053667 RepID=UPI003D68D568